jgi:glycosyltransferase involved in cell wall biosynthesis
MTATGRRESILFLIRSLGVGGAERQLALLAEGLSRRGHAVTVVTYYSGGTIFAELMGSGVEVVTLDKQGRWDIARPLYRLVREVQKRRPDIVHGYMPDANLLSLLVGRVFVRARVVWGLRASHYHFGHYDWMFHGLFTATRLLARFADLHITNSEAGRHYHVLRGYPAEKVSVVPNGVDTVRFRPDAESRTLQRRSWHIADDEVLIGVFARLDPMKDHLTFLRAAARLIDCRVKARFVCVGDGPADYAQLLRAQATSLGLDRTLRWEREVDDLRAAYNALDLLMSCSSSGEGFSNAIGEAMACGVHCVVTEVGDSAEIVGATGAVVPPGDVEGLVEACHQLLDRPRGDPRDRVTSEFGAARLVERTESLLAEVSGDRRWESHR